MSSSDVRNMQGLLPRNSAELEGGRAVFTHLLLLQDLVALPRGQLLQKSDLHRHMAVQC